MNCPLKPKIITHKACKFSFELELFQNFVNTNKTANFGSLCDIFR